MPRKAQPRTFEVSRAELYPMNGQDDPAAEIVQLALDQVVIDAAITADRVTIAFTTGDPANPFGAEFDLEPHEARGFGRSLMRAAVS